MTTAHLPKARVSEDVVELNLPALGNFAALPRTVATSLAARVNFTLDEIDDLRIAVSEVCAILTDAAPPGAALRCRFVLSRSRIALDASTTSARNAAADTDTFAWTVLEAVTDRVESHLRDGVLSVCFQKSGALHEEAGL